MTWLGQSKDAVLGHPHCGAQQIKMIGDAFQCDNRGHKSLVRSGMNPASEPSSRRLDQLGDAEQSTQQWMLFHESGVSDGLSIRTKSNIGIGSTDLGGTFTDHLLIEEVLLDTMPNDGIGAGDAAIPELLQVQHELWLRQPNVIEPNAGLETPGTEPEMVSGIPPASIEQYVFFTLVDNGIHPRAQCDAFSHLWRGRGGPDDIASPRENVLIGPAPAEGCDTLEPVSMRGHVIVQY